MVAAVRWRWVPECIVRARWLGKEGSFVPEKLKAQQDFVRTESNVKVRQGGGGGGGGGEEVYHKGGTECGEV
jgi:hypothetical protein